MDAFESKGTAFPKIQRDRRLPRVWWYMAIVGSVVIVAGLASSFLDKNNAIRQFLDVTAIPLMGICGVLLGMYYNERSYAPPDDNAFSVLELNRREMELRARLAGLRAEMAAIDLARLNAERQEGALKASGHPSERTST